MGAEYAASPSPPPSRNRLSAGPSGSARDREADQREATQSARTAPRRRPTGASATEPNAVDPGRARMTRSMAELPNRGIDAAPTWAAFRRPHRPRTLPRLVRCAPSPERSTSDDTAGPPLAAQLIRPVAPLLSSTSRACADRRALPTGPPRCSEPPVTSRRDAPEDPERARSNRHRPKVRHRRPARSATVIRPRLPQPATHGAMRSRRQRQCELREGPYAPAAIPFSPALNARWVSHRRRSPRRVPRSIGSGRSVG
jgi:hypothetical protein